MAVLSERFFLASESFVGLVSLVFRSVFERDSFIIINSEFLFSEREFRFSDRELRFSDREFLFSDLSDESLPVTRARI